MSYDQRQRQARHVCWLCCRRECFTTDYAWGCATCR